MIINNHFDKKYIELTEDKIIFYRFFGKRTLELKKIRAAYMDDNYIIRILYGKMVRQYEIANIKEGDKNLLRELIETLNKDEKLVFSSQYYPRWIWVAYMIFGISNLIDGGSIHDYVFSTFFIISSVTMIIIGKYQKIFIYDCINNSIILERNSKKVKEYFPNESKYKFEYNTSGDRYVFKANKSKAVMIPTNIIYPAYYRQKLSKLYNISNNVEAKTQKS
ncbi:hypothetical protein J1C67_18105 [Clostridium gasigenes]|uniref:hypothetical protein n=1 Tax=Clostridium gasigenes TaxID=94869 RepID=UPI0014383CE1|nr:hypothetical protein [Clostridium gasigenes]NKF05851.1 hypothetical protein [Clostridium gasigenes]QSW19417.1 hypothetical protein J1C67_18105 [Clostridium gasigenes]